MLNVLWCSFIPSEAKPRLTVLLSRQTLDLNASAKFGQSLECLFGCGALRTGTFEGWHFSGERIGLHTMKGSIPGALASADEMKWVILFLST